MVYLTFLTALLLSGIAEYYSVLGLTAIFTGAFWPIVFMGSVLGLSKLVTTSWLYRNWKNCPLLLKSYLTFAVIILMLITSMGIFGFLSKAHIDSTLNAGSNMVEVKTLNEQDKMVRDRLDYLLARAKEPSNASSKLDRQIQDTQKELAEINKKKLPLLKESNKLVAEVGPIKYVADMIYGSDADALDKAIRLVIMLIMVVFDPLAVLLLIASNMSLKEKNENQTVRTEIPTEDWFSTIQSNEERSSDKIEIKKENIASVEEKFSPKEEKIEIQLAPGVFGNTNYDYTDEFAFRKKENK
jgi:hypothetical protein